MGILDIFDSTILINFLFPICPKRKNCSTNNPGEGVGWGIRKEGIKL